MADNSSGISRPLTQSNEDLIDYDWLNRTSCEKWRITALALVDHSHKVTDLIDYDWLNRTSCEKWRITALAVVDHSHKVTKI